MANIFQFDEKQHGRSPLCIACEEMLADALDQTLSPADQAWFDKHVASCVDCSDMLADAQRGAAWLEMLKSPRPEPSAALMERIIAQTSGLEHQNLSPITIGQPAFLPEQAPAMPHGNVLAFRPRMPRLAAWMGTYAQPRLAMTAAMAFFSIALTLNLTGVRLDQIKAANLNPNNVRKTYYEASADAVRYYDNLRVVRVMESRVDDLRESSDSRRAEEHTSTPQPAPEPNTAPKPTKKDPSGPTSRILPTIPGAPSQMATSFQVGGNHPTLSTGSADEPKSSQAKSPTLFTSKLLFDPRRTHAHSLKISTQEGGLA